MARQRSTARMSTGGPSPHLRLAQRLKYERLRRQASEARALAATKALERK
jgi:hypothetical protein